MFYYLTTTRLVTKKEKHYIQEEGPTCVHRAWVDVEDKLPDNVVSVKVELTEKES